MRNRCRYVCGVSLAACLVLAGCSGSAATPVVIQATPVVVYVTPAPTPQVFPFGASVAGNVFFSQTPYDQSNPNCRFGAPIAVAATTDAFYMIAAFYDTLQVGDTYTLTTTKDGVSNGTTKATADTKFNCYIEKASLGPLPAGTWQFTFTHGGVIEAQGTITITP